MIFLKDADLIGNCANFNQSVPFGAVRSETALVPQAHCLSSSCQYGTHQTKKSLQAIPKCTDSDHSSHTQSITWGFALHSHIL